MRTIENPLSDLEFRAFLAALEDLVKPSDDDEDEEAA